MDVSADEVKLRKLIVATISLAARDKLPLRCKDMMKSNCRIDNRDINITLHHCKPTEREGAKSAIIFPSLLVFFA